MKKILFTASNLRNSVARKRLGILQQLFVLVFGLGNFAFGQTSTFSYTGGLQSYTVPENITAIYIQANGAQGGSTIANSFPATSATAGGLGAVMSGIFSVTPGHVLSILVGQQPAAVLSGAGGGGGTFVWDVTAGNVLLIAAGGGGGAVAEQSITPFSYTGINAVATNNGTGGGGGTGGAGVTGHGATSVNAPSNSWAGGGAGWLSNGAAGHSTVGSPPVNAGGGISPLNGGTGGSYGGKQTNNSNGGYGGGGGGQGNFVFFGGGGGGGGYSGGAGGAEAGAHDIEPGGGGGSYSTGCSQSNSVANTGNGQVVITTAQLYFVNCSPQSLMVCKNSTSNNINSFLTIHDLTPGLTETWSVVSSPSHGTLNGFNATGTSTSGNVVPSGLTYTPAEGYTGSDAITIQVSDGTYTSTTTINVMVEAPTISAGSNRAVCSGVSTTLTASGGIGYTWSPSNALSLTTGATVTANPTATTTYTATGTDSYGCSSTAAVTVSVNPLPAAYSVTGGGCSAGTGATIGLSGSQSDVIYQLKRGSTAVGSPVSGIDNAITFGATFTTAGTYTVVATYTATSCSANMAGSAVVSSTLPTVTSPASYAVCAGTSTSLSGSGAVSYSWSGGISNGISFTPTAKMTYTVTGTGSNGCTNTSVTTVSVNPLPASITGTTTTYPSTTVSLSDETSDGIWSSSNTAVATIGSLNGIVAGVQIGMATIIYTLPTGCYVTQDVIVAPFPPNGIGLGTAPTGPSSSASVIFSLRKMSSSYSGYAINVRRSSDNTTQDIGFDTYGNFDTASLKDFCGSGSGYVKSWYDQSGYGLNATQATTGIQPEIVSSGIIYRQNGLPSIYFNGNYLVTPSFAGLSSGYTTCVVAGVQSDVTYNTFGAKNSVSGNPNVPNPFDSYNGVMIIGDGPGGNYQSFTFVTGIYAASGFGQWTMGADPTQVVAWRYGTDNLVSGGAPAYYVDGNAPLYLGTRADFVTSLNGYVSEYTMFPTVLSTADRKTVECNQFTYYNNISGSSPVCAGSALTLTATYAGGTWSSSNSDVATAAGTGIVSGVAAGSATITYTVTNPSCSGATYFTKTITVNALPEVTSPANYVLCAGTSTSLSGSGAASYTWTGGIANGTTFTPAATVAYTVSGTDANGCVNTSTTTVTVNALPTVTSPASYAVCAGASTSLSGGGAVSYAWNGSITDGASFTPTATASYAVTGTDANGCMNTSTTTVTVNALPTVTSPADYAVCAGASTSLSGGGAVSYTWTGGITNGTTFTPTATAAYTVTGTDANGCMNISTTMVTVNALPTVTSPSSYAVCVGTSASLSGGGAVSYTWTGGITNGTTFTPTATTAYTVTGMDANGCVNTSTTTVTVNALPTVSAGGNQTVCVTNSSTNSSINLAPTPASGGTWTTTSGTVSGNTYSNTTSGTATVTYSYTDNHSCTNSNSATINVLPTFSIMASAGSNGSISPSGTAYICSGSTQTYTITPASGYYTSGITVDGGSVSVAGTYTFTSVSAAHTISATFALNCTAPSIASSATTTAPACHGGSTGSVTTYVSGSTPLTYAWSNGTSSASLSNVAAGTFTYTVTNSCGSVSGSATVSQPSALSATLTPTSPSCNTANSGNHSSGSISATVSGGTSPYSYSWSNSQTGATNTGLAIGTYSVTVTDAHSCSMTGSATVSQPTAVTSTITGSSTVLGGTASTFSGPSGLSYSWSISGGDHICDAKCHHNSAHVCGSGCDHYGHSCTSACHHHPSHVCTHQHFGDHHCNIYCHHNSGHSCNANCDHYGHSCTSACHHHTNHRCDHLHCGGAAISGSATGSSISILNPCCASVYTLTLTTTNSSGCSSTNAIAVTVTASASITVYSSLYTTGSGSHPSVTKSALATSLKVFNRNIAGHRDGNQSHYTSVWNSTSGLVTNVSVSSPTVVNIGGGPAYQYIVTVPADGRYLVIGKSSISSSYCSGGTCSVYSGKKLGANDDDDNDHGHDDDDDDDLDPCSSVKVRFNTIMKDHTGKCTEGDTHQEHGSLMLVVTPTTLVFTDSTSLLPVVYESVEGDWISSVTADPPYGFYSTPADALTASVTDSLIDAVQFVITDTGSEWTNTTLTHTIQHKGAQRIAYSHPAMVNERTNKPSAIDVMPNPAVDKVKVTLPKFEGRATIYIYNMAGQAVASKPVEIANGESISMDISQLPNGVYMISAENPEGKASTRLIKNGK